MTTAAVFGTGSWGTAFAAVLADAGTTVTMWGRRPEVVEAINAGCNTDYLPDLRLPAQIRAVYRLDVNEYNGKRALQLTLEHRAAA